MNQKPLSNLFEGRSRLFVFILVPLLVAAGLFAFTWFTPPELEVHYINVGTGGLVGDAILLQTSDGKVVLIDGGYPNTGALQYLQARNIQKIDMVILSHPHDDHIGGLIEVLNTIPVKRVVTNGEPIDTQLYEDFQSAIRQKGLKEEIVRTGDKLRVGRLTFQVISPSKVSPIGHNNNSIVLKLVVGKVSFLFTGDMQKLEEERLLSIDFPVDVDILKVAHHGSDSSSAPAFLVAVAPDIAIYSSGKGNMHGLPMEVTLDNLVAVGATVYGTDTHGTIIVLTDGSTYTVHTEQGGTD
jgi:competence protein ComEC